MANGRSRSANFDRRAIASHQTGWLCGRSRRNRADGARWVDQQHRKGQLDGSGNELCYRVWRDRLYWSSRRRTFACVRHHLSRLRPVSFWVGRDIMAKSNLRLVSPHSELRKVTLRRRSNRDMGRDREHLTELEGLIKAAKGNRHGQRDATMILIGYRHGLRVSELCDLPWSSIAFETGTMHVRRAKGGEAATHPILGDELRALRELRRQSASPSVFASERCGPFTPSGSPSCWRAPAGRRGWASRRIRICYGTTRASIPEPCRPTSAIAQSPRPRAMRRWRRVGSRTSGGRRRKAGVRFDTMTSSQGTA